MNPGHPPRLAIAVGSSDHITGPEAAPVTLVEYGDFECGYCGAAYPIVKEIQRRLGDQLRFVFRHFPLTTVHPHAQNAAEASEAAAVHGRFWPMHDILFEHQTALGDDDLFRYGVAVGLPETRFATEVIRHVHAERVREDMMGGVRSGVNGTPSFFINGVRHDGSYDLPTLLGAVEARIAGVPGRGGQVH